MLGVEAPKGHSSKGKGRSGGTCLTHILKDGCKCPKKLVPRFSASCRLIYKRKASWNDPKLKAHICHLFSALSQSLNHEGLRFELQRRRLMETKKNRRLSSNNNANPCLGIASRVGVFPSLDVRQDACSISTNFEEAEAWASAHYAPKSVNTLGDLLLGPRDIAFLPQATVVLYCATPTEKRVCLGIFFPSCSVLVYQEALENAWLSGYAEIEALASQSAQASVTDEQYISNYTAHLSVIERDTVLRRWFAEKARLQARSAGLW
eukprot:3856478-Amphidinium_carterae.1